MLTIRSLLLTIFTISCFSSFGQNYYPPVVNYSTKEYGKDRNPENYCVIQDQRGVMYFGNSNGILEYDGTNWSFVDVIMGTYVRSMAIDSSGVIYVGTYMDFGYISANESGALEYVSLVSLLPEDDRYFSTIWSIHATKTNVYFQADESFFDYDLETEGLTTIWPTDMSSFHLSFMVDGELHLKAREIGIVKYANGELERLHGTENVRDLGVFGLYKLEDDSLLMITQEIGLWKWKDGGSRQLPELNETPLSEIGIYGSTRLSNGNIVLTTFSNGMYVIDSQGKIIKQLNRSKGLRSNDLKSVFQDRDRNLWLGLGNGISKVNHHSPLSFFDEKKGLEGNVQATIRFKGDIYVGTSSGLFVQDQSRQDHQVFVNRVANNQVWDFEVVDNHLFVASALGIFKTTDGKNYTQITNVSANVITYHEHSKRFVVAGSQGVFVYTKDFRLLWKEDEESYSRFLSCVVDPAEENTIWMGTNNTGVIRLRFHEDDFVLDRYGYFDGLNDNERSMPISLEGSIVFGSTEGIQSFITEDEMVLGLDDSLKNDPNYYRGMFQAESLYDSLFSSQVLFIQEEEDRTWYCSEDKIGYYDKETGKFIDKPFWGIDYGRVNKFYLEEDGVFWVGCADGLIRYERNDNKVYESSFYSLIRSFAIRRDSVIFNGAFAQDGVVQNEQNDEFNFEFDYEYNDVTFTFAAPYFEDDHKPEFSFFLEGLDENWTNWGYKTEATFTNLREGDYCFKVKARNIYGTISEEAQFNFSISPPWYRTSLAIAGYAVGMILVFFLGFRLFSLRLKRKNIWLEGVVEERTREISEKNTVLRHQKQEIEDSINYAQRIQEAILPLENEMKHWLPNSFVLFRPKDIVSGDFYWFTEKDGKLIFICADCTGHGVPGAFMSMIGSDRLNIIVGERKILNPGLILSELNRDIKKSLKQDGASGSTKDGMDAAVCTLDLKTKELRYSGANRPLWIVDGDELIEIKATKVAVAGFTPDSQVFDEHVIPLKENLKFYMTSDGYADQFGGERGKKLKVKSLKELILKICNNDFGDQRDELEDKLVQWMGDHEQIDDVCVIGFKPFQ